MNWALALVPLGLLVLGLPIYLVLLTTCTVVILGFSNLPLEVLPQVLFGSVNKVTLISLPFFVLAGEIMAQGGIARRIVDFVLALIGHVRGSLGITAVASCTAFGAVSGSSPATVAAIGRILYQPLCQRGYGERFASSVLTSCGGLATVIPPSVSMILYGAAAQQSVSLLFIAGILPGIVIALLIATYVYVYAAKRNLVDAARFEWSKVADATREGGLALAAPIIILGGIYGGIFTPTEAGGVACLYAGVVTTLVYREISAADLWRICVRSMYLTAQIFIVVAAAGVYSWLLTVGGIPAAATSLIEGISSAPWITLLLINVMLLIVGCFIDPTSAILVLTPLLVPIATHAGVDLIHFGLIMVVNLEIGMFTPPFGLNIFVAQSIFRTPLRELYVGLVPFILLNLVGLVLVTYVPELSLFLTRFVQ
jgi:C4-dicarboxylate transporter DctM subunit